MSERFFSGLTYSLANEDSRVEQGFFPEGARSALVVCGSGARVLPLLARAPERLEVIDLSDAQLYLCELRIAAARALEYFEFLGFLGYPAPPVDRVGLFGRLELSPACRKYWKDRASIWATQGFLKLGRWEAHFRKLAFLLRHGARIDAKPFFKAENLEEQRDYFERRWPTARFRLFLRAVLGEWAFDRMLYRGAIGTDESEPLWKAIDRALSRGFTEGLARENFFLQMLFLGGVAYPEGVPLEAKRETWEAVRSSQARVEYRRGDLLARLREEAFDFYSLSDVVSFLDPKRARALFDGVPGTGPARAVVRSFKKHPIVEATAGWRFGSALSARAERLDCTGVYRIRIFDRI